MGRRTWGEMPSSSDLAALVKCEVEFVHERTTGQERRDAETVAKSRAGQRAHDQAQVRMETFHNRPRPSGGPASPPASAPDSRCFVASAAFGPDAPETLALRSYRDRVLLRRRWGRPLVRFYYGVSPPLAAFVASRPMLRRAARSLLKHLVRALH